MVYSNYHGRGAGNCEPKRGYLAVVCVLTLLAGLSFTPAKAATPPEQHVIRVGSMALAVARGNDSTGQKISDLRSIMSRFADMQSIALFSLGRFRKKLPESQRLRYIDLMGNFVAKFMVGFSKQFAGRHVKILKTKKRSATDVIVESQIIYASGASPTPVKWRVLNRGGGPKIFDIQVRGVWLTLRIRSIFGDILKRNNGDFNALYAFMSR